MNTKKQGDLGVATAIQFFLSRGWGVSLPFGDSARYDLIVDDGDKLHRVQVKSTRYRKPSGSYQVQISTNGGNQSWNGECKTISKDETDWLFVSTDSGDTYLIPVTEVLGRRNLTLSTTWEVFRQGPAIGEANTL